MKQFRTISGEVNSHRANRAQSSARACPEPFPKSTNSTQKGKRVTQIEANSYDWDGLKLRCWREHRGWTVPRLAGALCMSAASVYAYELGRLPPLHVAHRIVRLTKGKIRYRDIYPDFLPEYA